MFLCLKLRKPKTHNQCTAGLKAYTSSCPFVRSDDVHTHMGLEGVSSMFSER